MGADFTKCKLRVAPKIACRTSGEKPFGYTICASVHQVDGGQDAGGSASGGDLPAGEIPGQAEPAEGRGGGPGPEATGLARSGPEARTSF